MRVLGLCSYPVQSAATRFRLAQYVEPLRSHGIELTIEPFLDSRRFREMYEPRSIARKAVGLIPPLLERLSGLVRVGRYDALLVQREAMFFGPAVFEWLYQTAGRLPMVLDLDDATYVRYTSPSYGKVGSFFKFFGKTDRLIRRSSLVICGNRFIGGYASAKGARTRVIPTIADTDIFQPVEKSNEVPVVGWIGTHSTFPFLRSIFPVLRDLAKRHRFRLRVVGAGERDIAMDGVPIENLRWDLDREPADFTTLDVGLYPIFPSDSADQQWLRGKSGFKAIQYLAVGVPFVMSPVGVCAEIGVPNVTHFNAVTPEDWYNSLSRMLEDAELRRRMGSAGRSFSLANFALPAHAGEMARSLSSVIRGA